MLKKIFSSFILITIFSSILLADKLSDIKNSGILIAGVKYDFKPFGYLDEEKNVIGFDIDLLKYIAQKLDVDIKFKQVTSKTRIPLVAGGEIDIVAASMTHQIKRDDTIDFTISYFFDSQAILVKQDSNAKIAKDFSRKKVGAIRGATSGDNFKKFSPKADIVYFSGYKEALISLNTGKIDAITTDLVWCAIQARESNDTLKVTSATISSEPYGMGIVEDESNFRDAINFAIQESVKDGTYTKLYKKWFGKNPKRLPELWP